MGMKTVIVYVYPGDVVPKSVDYAWRFVASYRRFPAGAEHDTLSTEGHLSNAA